MRSICLTRPPGHIPLPFVSPGGRLPGSAVETRQRRISVRSRQTIAQKAGGERQPQGFAAGSQQTEERNPDGSQRGGAAGGGNSAATASFFDPAGRPEQKPHRPIGSLQRPHKGQDGFTQPASVNDVQHVRKDAVVCLTHKPMAHYCDRGRSCYSDVSGGPLKCCMEEMRAAAGLLAVLRIVI